MDKRKPDFCAPVFVRGGKTMLPRSLGNKEPWRYTLENARYVAKHGYWGGNNPPKANSVVRVYLK